MRIKCGPTAEERRAAREAAENEWHSIFAWLPIRVGGECRWLEYVERRRLWLPFGACCQISYDDWEYRPIRQKIQQQEADNAP